LLKKPYVERARIYPCHKILKNGSALASEGRSRSLLAFTDSPHRAAFSFSGPALA
jgi:hypothetical protein